MTRAVQPTVPTTDTVTEFRRDFAFITRTGWIRYPGKSVAGPVRDWTRRMETRANFGKFCTFDGHGGFQVTAAGRALAAKEQGE